MITKQLIKEEGTIVSEYLCHITVISMPKTSMYPTAISH